MSNRSGGGGLQTLFNLKSTPDYFSLRSPAPTALILVVLAPLWGGTGSEWP